VHVTDLTGRPLVEQVLTRAVRTPGVYLRVKPGGEDTDRFIMVRSVTPSKPASIGLTARHLFVLFVAVVGALNAVLFAMFAVAVLREGPVEFLREDGPLENLTVILYLVALALAISGIWVAGPSRRWIALSVAALAAFFALEELSYGERIFGFQPPIVLGVRFDAAHDGLDIGIEAWRLAMSERPLLTLGVAVPLAGLAVWSAWRIRASLAAAAGRLWRDPAVRFMAVAFALNAFAMVADLVGHLSKAIVLLEESAEATASLAVLFASLTLTLSHPVAGGPRTHE
jgi:hypothetical protein